MKNSWFGGLIVFLLLTSCLDPDLPNVNGMWQLKTIQEKDDTVWMVDTIYYSFQRQALFAYTILNSDTAQTNPTDIIYGFVDFPGKEELHIQIDKKYTNNQIAIDRLLWKDIHTTYTILKLNSKEMILGQDEKKYNFIKF
jgi:hypothetical protein